MRKRTLLVASSLIVLASTAVLAQQEGVQAVVGNVFLQNTTPGTAQVGHATLTGTFRAGQVFVQQASNVTIPVVGNSTATSGATFGGSFSAASPIGTGLRGTATSLVGTAIGVTGTSRAANGIGVHGNAVATAGTNIGVLGISSSANGTGVLGVGQGALAFGVHAKNTDTNGPALVAENTAGGMAARFHGDTDTFGTASVRDGLILRNANGLSGVVAFATTADSRLNVLFSGGTAAVSSFTQASDCRHSLVSGNVVQVELTAGSNGVGTVTADVKNFVQPDPDDEQQDIVYASVEGPEAAAYKRGTARLVNGRATVALPRHFQNVSVAEGMTVQLTPLSGASEGLAVVRKSLASFEVVELRSGKGSYEFDWEVKAVRRGFTDYQVYRRWDEHAEKGSDASKAMTARKANARKVYGITYGPRRP